MKSNSFKYLVKTGVKNFWTNRVMAFASVGILTICLLIVGVAFLITTNVNKMVGYIENQSEMNVYLKQEVTQEQIDEFSKKLDGYSEISEKKFISKEEGLKDFQNSLGNDGYLLDDLHDDGRNTIPDTFVIKLNDISKTREFQEKISKIENVDSVAAAGDVADTLTYLRKTITTIGYIVTAVLALISLVIISNTIRATIFARRKEINIMKFVGATNSFIRIPFLVEGFTMGTVSAVIAFLATWGSYSYVVKSFTKGAASSFLSGALSSIMPFSSLALMIFGLFFVSGIFLGVIGSLISIRNHIKV